MSAFVCRGDDLAAMSGALERPPALLLVEGEAGVGKTRLVQECLLSGPVPDHEVLVLTCPPLPEPFPLGPVVDGLRRVRATIGDLALSPLAGALRPLFPEWVDDLPPSPEPMDDMLATRHRVYRALAELTERLGLQVIVVEDAHWADTATLEWLLTVCSSGGNNRSTVVTYRPQDLSPESLLRRLASRAAPGVGRVRIELEPLDVDGIRELTASMFGTEHVSTEFALLLFERTGGIPLAVEECLRLLHDRGDIVRRGGEWARRGIQELRVPPTVRDSVLERVERLGRSTRRVLEAVAVLAVPADVVLVASVAGLAPTTAADAAEEGLRAGLLREAGPGAVWFRHVLAAEAVEDAIPALARMQMHQRAGEALRQQAQASVVRLSRHFREAGDEEGWCQYAEASADLALDSGDDHTAVSILHELLTTLEHAPDRRVRLARKLGEAAASGAAGLRDRAERVIETLREVLGDSRIAPGERGEIRLLLGRLLRWYGQAEAAYREIEAAVPDLTDRPGLACRAMMNLGTAFSRDWPAQRHLEWIERANAQLSQVDSPSERLNAAVVRTSALLALGEEAGWNAERELPRSAGNLFEQRMLLRATLDVGQLATTWGRYAEARKRLDTSIELVQSTGYRRLLNIALVARAYLDWFTGAWAELGDKAARLAEADETEPEIVRMEARQIQGMIELVRGARETAERRLLEVLTAYARRALLVSETATTAAALGRLYLANRAHDETLQITEPMITMIMRKGMWLWATDVAPVYVDALIAVGELGRAAEVAEHFTNWAAGRPAPAPAAASLLCQAILVQARGDHLEAGVQLAEVARAWAKLPRPYDELLALERQGCCLLAAGEPDRALVILSAVRRRADQLGARWDADRIARTLRQHGVEVPRPWRSGPRGYGDRLSPREQDVLALVARGMTNAEAGRVLFLSPRTVGHHISTAMRKLGVSTRTRAVMAAVDAGLLQVDSTTEPGHPSQPSGRNNRG